MVAREFPLKALPFLYCMLQLTPPGVVLGIAAMAVATACVVGYFVLSGDVRSVALFDVFSFPETSGI